MQTFIALNGEVIKRRAPLGLKFLDMVRGVTVNDNLIVQAWREGTPGPKQSAVLSPFSGIYGFHSLPGLRSFETSEPDGGPTAAPLEPTSDELLKLDTLRQLVQTDEATPVVVPNFNFVVTVTDNIGRFLPQVLVMGLPKLNLVEVPLFSSPARLAPAGLGVVRGEIKEKGSSTPASWALVTASLDATHTYTAVADARGMFCMFIPYSSALPPLVGNPPAGGQSMDQLTWTLTIGVFYQPSQQRVVAGVVAPPDTRSILEQAQAQVYDTPGVHALSLTRLIHFGQTLVVATATQSQLLIDMA